MEADLDTLLIAPYVELEDRIIPAHRPTGRRRPGRPPVLTDAELVYLAVAQVLLRYYDERYWLRAARSRVGHLFPRLLGQSEYNERLKTLAPLMEAALRWLAEQTPGSGESLRLMDGTPIPSGASKTTTQRSNLFGYAGYGYETSHSRFYWGMKLMLITTADGTVTGFGLANPKLVGEREQTRTMLCEQPANRPVPGTVLVADKGLRRQGLRGLPHRRAGPAAGPSRPRRREAPGVPQLATPAGRGDHLDVEEPARSRAARRPGPGRAVDPGRATPAGAQRRDLAQLEHRRPGQAIIDRLRSLDPPPPAPKYRSPI